MAVTHPKPLATRYQVLALDLDGTVVGHDLSISPRVKKRLHQLVNHSDCRVVIATGRMSVSARRFAADLGVQEPVIAYQGAMIRDMQGQCLFHSPIPLDVAKELVADLFQQGIATNVYMDDVLYMHRSNPYQEAYAKLGGTTPVMVDDLVGCLTQAPTKLLLIDDHQIDAILAGIQTRYAGILAPCKSRQNFCEVIGQQVSKWAGLSWLIAQWGIPPEQVMAVGDQGNDISMLTAAGWGVAMGNAPDEVKTLANAITTPIEQDGVAEAIEQYLLI
jgi:Cof subfamily protein (haloacid dehalogenase superfamily)